MATRTFLLVAFAIRFSSTPEPAPLTCTRFCVNDYLAWATKSTKIGSLLNKVIDSLIAKVT